MQLHWLCQGLWVRNIKYNDEQKFKKTYVLLTLSS